jgi:two-component system response regulator AtoC
MKVLVVDDEKNIRESVERYLELEGIHAVGAENGIAAQRRLSEEPFQAVVMDLRMPGMTGIELLQWLQEEGPRTPAIMISAYGEVSDAVNAMKLGAEDYIVKPFDPRELVVRLKKITEERRNKDLLELGRRTGDSFTDLIGESELMQRIKKLIERIAATQSTVLITGESGTGKEVIARTIHRHSPVAEGPFTAVNLGGLPEGLLESELFGFEKGAFTGAGARKVGMFELSHGGTLFLDEIGDVPLHLQVKLLRAIQERKIQRLGGTQLIPLDARIIAATNRNLEERVKANEFREDLFYRLNVVRIEVPPLSRRREDIPLLAGFLLEKLSRRLGKRIDAIEPDALDLLMGWSFPGNVRELENLIERAIIFAEASTISVSDIDLPARAGVVSPVGRRSADRPRSLREVEREKIVEALLRWEGNRTRAAEDLGITRRTLFNKIKEYGLD